MLLCKCANSTSVYESRNLRLLRYAVLACCTHQLRHHLGSLAVGCWEADDCLGLAFIERQGQRQGILVLAGLHQHVNALKHTSQRPCTIWNSP